jgi:hypothetical protein
VVRDVQSCNVKMIIAAISFRECIATPSYSNLIDTKAAILLNILVTSSAYKPRYGMTFSFE